MAMDLGTGFGAATATVVSTNGESVVIEIHVVVSGDADAVVAHLTLPGDPDFAIPMLSVGGGGYQVTTEVKRANYSVVFETLGGAGLRSEPATLQGLGVDTQPLVNTTIGDDEGYSSRTTGWMWLAIAFAAASLATLAFWVLGGRDEPDDDHDPAPPESISAP